MLRNIFVFCSLAIALLACKEEEQFLFTISPQNAEVYSIPGNILNVKILAHSTQSLDRLVVVQRWETGVSEILTTRPLQGKDFNDTYTITVPEFTTASFQLIFTIYTSENHSETQVLSVKDYSDVQMSQNGPYMLRSAYSADGNNGFDLGAMKLISLNEAPETGLILRELDLTDDGIPSNMWTSTSDAVFTRDTTFNFNTATPAAIAAAMDEVSFQVSATEGSVILIRHGQSGYYTYAVARIEEVKDEPGTGNDGYVFYIKK